MKNGYPILVATTVAVLLGVIAPHGRAQLLNVTQSFPDTTATGSPYLVYDHDAVDSNTGLLRLVAGAAQLAEGAAAGNSTLTQTYLGAGDPVPNVLLSIRIRNGNGGFTAGTFLSGVVSVGYGNTTGTGGWRWDGAITALGSRSGTGTILDAAWNVTGDQYQNVPANMNQFVNGFLSGQTGGIKIQSSASWGSTNNFSNDWVYGLNPASNTNLDNYRTGMDLLLAGQQVNSAISADIFVAAVPEPELVWLMLLGTILFAPFVRARMRR